MHLDVFDQVYSKASVLVGPSTDPRHRVGSRPSRVPSCVGGVPLARPVAPGGWRRDPNRHVLDLPRGL